MLIKDLILIPTGLEYKGFTNALHSLGIETKKLEQGPLPQLQIPEWKALVAQGGLGKVKFAVSCRYLLDLYKNVESCICLGAAGSLDEELKNGDLIAATETVEHDIRKAGKEWIPRNPGSRELLSRTESLEISTLPFKLHFHPIASGDEDIVSPKRKSDLRQRLNCHAVAWEGAGGAEACRFSGTSYMELRGISDQANLHTPADFKKNVALIMEHGAKLLQLFYS